MSTRNKTILLSVAIGLFSYASLKAHDMPAARPSSKDFEQMKMLVGSWKGMTTHPDAKVQTTEPVETHFKLTAAGSAIEETLMPGTPHEMVDMYHDEGGKLTMTHYCAIGNQPHMLVKQAGPGQIVFEMGPTPGIDSTKDMHMHILALEFPDANHLTERWTSYANGKAGDKVIMTMTRVQ